MRLCLLEADGRASARIGERLAFEVLGIETGDDLGRPFLFQDDVAADDLAGGEIAVLDALRDVICVNRLPEVVDVAGPNALVLTRSLRRLGYFQGGRRRG